MTKPARKKRARKPPPLPPLPPLPALPVDPVAKPGPPPASIAQLQPPNVDDPLAAQAYIHLGLVASFHDAALDPNLSPRERRKEMRAIAYAASRLIPQARIHRAEQLVIKHMGELEAKARHRRGAQLEKLPKAPIQD